MVKFNWNWIWALVFIAITIGFNLNTFDMIYLLYIIGTNPNTLTAYIAEFRLQTTLQWEAIYLIGLAVYGLCYKYLHK